MKIFFIIPPNIHYIEPYAFVKADKSNTVRPYMGLLYVAAELRRSLGIEVRVIDSNADGLTLEDIESIIAAEAPDIVGFSVLTFNLLNCMEVCKLIRRRSPDTKICFGGWHPTLYPNETLELDCVDYIIIGEGERTFSELVDLLRENRGVFEQELDSIKGIGYKTINGAININSPRELIKNLDELPFPAYDLVNINKYSNLLACTGNTVTIMTSRGCPQKCVFCDMRRTPYRFRTPANIIEEIKFWIKNGVKEFFIQDDNFTINRKRTMEFCRLIVNAGLDIKYKISSRVDYLDGELLGCLKESGCYRIYFGVESGSQRVLDYLGKGITVEQIKKTFQLAKRCKIDCCAYIMIGAPPETKEDIEMTTQLMKEIGPQHLHCSICTPMPKTYLYQKLLDERIIEHDYWLDFAKKPDPAFKTPFISPFFSSEELRDMQNLIQRQFYLSPKIIWQEIIKTRGVKQFVTKSKMAFKMFFH